MPQHSSHDAHERLPAGARTLWLAIVVVGGALFFVHHDLAVARHENFAPWSEAGEVKESGSNAVKGLALAMIGLLGLWLWLRREGRPVRVGSLLSLLMLFYLGWAVASLSWSIAPAMTARRVAVLAFCFLGALGMARQLPTRGLATLALVIPAVYLAAGLCAELGLGTFRPWSSGYRFAGTVHPNTQGAHLALLGLSALVLARGASSVKLRAGLGALLAVALVFLLLTKSRTALGGLVLGAGAIWLVCTSARTRVFAMLAGGFASSLAALAVSLAGVDARQDLAAVALLGRQEESELLTGRIPIWLELTHYANERLLTGYGYESFWTVQHIEEASGELQWRFREAHCAYLDTVLGVGLIGGAALLLSVLLGMRQAKRAYQQTGNPDHALTLGLLVYCLVSAVLESGVAGMNLPTLVAGCGMVQLGFLKPENAERQAGWSPVQTVEAPSGSPFQRTSHA